MNEIEELDVRVHRIGGPGRGGGGLPTVVWAFVVVLVAVVGLAVVGDRLSGTSPEPSDAAVNPASPSAGPSRTPRPSRVPPSPTPPPVLPTIPNMGLVRAPQVLFAERAGDDLELRTWRPGQAMFRLDQVVAGAFEGVPNDHPAWADLPPNGQFAAVVHYIPQSDDSVRSRVRVVGSGLPAWESDELAYGAQLVWSTDSSMLAIGGGPVWTVVRIAPGEDTTVTSVRVAAEPAASQSPSPSGSVAPTPDSFQPGFPVPVAFSVDGRRLYGATARETPPSYGPALQVDLGGTEPTVVSIDRYPTGDSERLAPTGWPGDMIDPDTGRIAELSYNGPRPAIVILDPGAPVGEPIEVGGDVSGLMWAGDGRLLVSTNTPLDATGEAYSVDVRWIDSDGSRGPIALSAERVNGFATMATRPDYALLLFGADEQLLVVLLRTSDGATATVRLRQEDFMDLVAIDLVDPLALR